MNNDFLTGLLAQILHTFKAKSPKAWAWIAFILTGVLAITTLGPQYGIWNPSETLKTILTWVTFAAGLLTGSRTTKYLPGKSAGN